MGNRCCPQVQHEKQIQFNIKQNRTISTQAEFQAQLKQFSNQRQALDKHYKIQTQSQQGKTFIKTLADLDMNAINQTLEQFASKNGYDSIKLIKQKTLRGGDYHRSEIEVKDKKITIKQMIEQMFCQKEKVGSYYYDVLEANKDLKLLTEKQLEYFKQFKDQVDELFVSANVYKNKEKSKTFVDVAFVIDSTGSMDSLFQHAKQTCDTIAKQARFQNKQIDFKFALITYRDHANPYSRSNDEAIENLYDFSDFTNIYKKVGENKCTGGDDTAQAIHDGLYTAGTKLSWRKQAFKYVWLIADAPPHGRQYHRGQCLDNYPAGCPCGISLNQIVKIYQQKKINFQFCPVSGGNTYYTDQVFKKYFSKCNYHLNNTKFKQFFDDFSEKINEKFQTFQKLLPKIQNLMQAFQKKRNKKAVQQTIRLLQKQAQLEKQLKAKQMFEKHSQKLLTLKKNITTLNDQFKKNLKQLEAGMKQGYEHTELSQKALKIKQFDLLVQNLFAAFNQTLQSK